MNSTKKYDFPAEELSYLIPGSDYYLCWGRLAMAPVTLIGPSPNAVDHCVVGKVCSFSLVGSPSQAELNAEPSLQTVFP